MIFGLLAFLLTLTVVVTIHEFGHYLPARLFGLKVDAFSIGFGKELFGYTDKHQTRWKVSLIPLGGFVSLPDMENGEGEARIPLWKRAVVVFGGPCASILTAPVLFVVAALAWGIPYQSTVLSHVVPNSPAANAGVQVGDEIVAVDGTSRTDIADLKQYLASVPSGTACEFEIVRDGKTMVLHITPVNHIVGVAGAMDRREATVDESVSYGVSSTYTLVTTILGAIKEMVTSSDGYQNLGGIITIGTQSSSAASLGMESFIYWIILLSVNLGIFNLLPLPILDGGHLLRYGVEAVRGQPLSEAVNERIAKAGVVIFFGLFLLTFVLDISRLFK